MAEKTHTALIIKCWKADRNLTESFIKQIHVLTTFFFTLHHYVTYNQMARGCGTSTTSLLKLFYEGNKTVLKLCFTVFIVYKKNKKTNEIHTHV